MRKKFLTAAALVCAASMAVTGCSSSNNNNEDTSKASESGNNEQDGTNEESTEDSGVTGISGKIEYAFADSVKDKAGYAEGTVTFSANKKGTYNLYWSNDENSLAGYYEIASLEIEEDNGSKTVDFGYHTAIPAGATKMIAVSASDDKDSYSVGEAVAVYDIETSKQLPYSSDDALYTFSSISDVHIDEEHWGEAPGYWWEYSEDHWAKALAYSTAMGVDFIVSSGDQVTNASITNLDKEWNAYQYILSQSDYCNPIYEAGGNHEVRQDGVVDQELAFYVKGSGLDNNMETISSGNSYYYITEENTGDLFIFMSLEGGYRPAQYDEFTNAQIDWLEGILKENYGKGKNIYVIQHALIKGYGPGDDLETPYYGGSLSPTLETSKRFISLLEEYKDIVWISGHSHETYTLDYNYTNNNGESCNMIHNSSVGNPTHVVDGKISYDFNEDLSQGYYVQAFANSIIFSGANYCDSKIYPLYSYIIDGNTSTVEKVEVKAQAVNGTTAGNLRSITANAGVVLGLTYELSSYNQYQSLKKLYYQYKDADIDALGDEEICQAYGEFKEAIATLTGIADKIKDLELTVNTTKSE